MRNQSYIRSVVLVLLFSSMIACSPRVGSQQFLAEAGASHFGPQQQYVIFDVPSAGSEDDEELYRNTILYGGSDIVNRLASLIARSEKTPLKIVVGGPSSEKTRYVVMNALKLNEGRTVGGLMIVFIGKEADAALVANKATAMLATVYYTAG